MTRPQNCYTKGVREFFEGKTIFITGGTGFIGHVLVEKLLRSCPGISRIYLLVRAVDAETMKSRLEKVFSSPVFSKLREQSPTVLDKIEAIRGDLSQPELGLCKQDKELLENEVNIVYHSGATVRFDEPLKIAVTVNIGGTQEVVKLCKKMKKLKAVVHVSTVYSNCLRAEVEEIIYPASIRADDIINLMKYSDENLINEISDKMVGKYPNTYTFTKGITEQWLSENKEDLPMVIVRPSIVLSCFDEPIKGWLKNYAGPTGLVAAGSKGLYRCLPLGKDMKSDLVPVDMCVNLMIVASWHMGIKSDTTLEIYNFCSGTQNPITWHNFTYQAWANNIKNPPTQIFWYPSRRETQSAIVQKCNEYLFHWLPALTIDLILIILRQNARVFDLQKKVSKGLESVKFFIQNDWKFDDRNVRNLNMMLTESEKKDFNFDVTKINWVEYLNYYSLGMRRYLLKEDDSTLPKARANLSRFYWIDKAFQALLVMILASLLWRRV